VHRIAPQASVRLTVGHLEAAGTALVERGKPGLAADFFRSGLAASPRDPCLLTSLASVLRLLGQSGDAEATLREAIAIERTARRLVALAAIVRERGRNLEGEELLREAIDLDSDLVDAWAALGGILVARWLEGGQSDELIAEATELLERTIQARPDDLDALAGLLVCYQSAERYDDWCDRAEIAATQHPACHELQVHHAFSLIKTGDLRRGLPAAARTIYSSPAIADCPLLRYPVWQPDQCHGPVVVWNAEGAGDGFQFARYFALAARDGAEIQLICNKPEAALMARCPGVAKVLPPEDVTLTRHATIFSLAATYTTCEEEIPWAGLYLSAGEEAVLRWWTRLQDWDGLTVGLAWQGNPKQATDRRRSFRLETMAPIWSIPGVRFVALQKDCEDELAGTPVRSLGPEYEAGDWHETAAVIANLDLVISSDTGIAHLAGAMGKPVWTALWEPCCWRWMIGREDTPWYPTMKLWRQWARGSWEGVFEKMADQLRGIARAEAA
jgi:tetratricopeptide (TPR) repeat protein